MKATPRYYGRVVDVALRKPDGSPWSHRLTAKDSDTAETIRVRCAGMWPGWTLESTRFGRIERARGSLRRFDLYTPEPASGVPATAGA